MFHQMIEKYVPLNIGIAILNTINDSKYNLENEVIFQAQFGVYKHFFKSSCKGENE